MAKSMFPLAHLVIQRFQDWRFMSEALDYFDMVDFYRVRMGIPSIYD